MNQTAQELYDQLEDRLDDLAAELLASPAYQRASSPAARKQAAERFLIPHADGFFPPALIRDELYARAQKLAKAARALGERAVLTVRGPFRILGSGTALQRGRPNPAATYRPFRKSSHRTCSTGSVRS